MRRVRLFFIASVGVGFAAAACSLVTNLDPLAGKGTDAGAKDGDVADTNSSSDARADVAPPFCQGKDADLCADFDESTLLQAQWESLVTNGGATLLESTTEFTSPPRAFRASLGAPVADAAAFSVFANLGKNFALAGRTRVRIEADVRFESATYGSNDYTQYFTWIAQPSIGGPSIGATGIVRDSTHGWTVVVLTTAVSYLTMTTPPPENKWTHLSSEVVLGIGTAGSVAVSFDGKPALATTAIATTKSTPVAVGVVAGFAAPTGNAPKVGMTCDNVVVTILP